MNKGKIVQVMGPVVDVDVYKRQVQHGKRSPFF